MVDKLSERDFYANVNGRTDDDGIVLESDFYEFSWVPFLWAVEHHNGITYASCISTGLYVVQLDIDIPYLGTNV